LSFGRLESFPYFFGYPVDQKSITGTGVRIVFVHFGGIASGMMHDDYWL